MKRLIKTFLIKAGMLNNPNTYINCREIVRSAKKEGLSICDYVEKIWEQKGSTQKVINEMQKAGCFLNCQNILEIGTGTGRYLEKIKQQMDPDCKYVIYETAEDWAYWLGKNYNVTRRDADGYSLEYETNNSFDLVHAHGVFVYLNLINSFQYFKEMNRVTKPGGHIVFDFYPVEKFDVLTIEKYMAHDLNYPVLLSSATIKNYFINKGGEFIGEFANKHGQGHSYYHIYKKKN